MIFKTSCPIIYVTKKQNNGQLYILSGKYKTQQQITMKFFDFLQYDTVVGSINEHGNHWCLLVIELQINRMSYLNPMGEDTDNAKIYLKNWR